MKPWLRTVIDASVFFGYAVTFHDMSVFGWTCSVVLGTYPGWRYAELKERVA